MNYITGGLQMIYNRPTPPVPYHGLVNQGATCYLNSVLQVLFMTEDFRAAVKRHNPDTDCIDRHLASLFDDLLESTSYTYKITRMLGIDRVYEQRDAAEYFEKILRATSPEASQIFHGQLTHKTICSTCHDETDADGKFWHLPLALVDSYSECYSVVNGIEEYFRTAHFSGDNQMYCDQCDEKSDATIQCVVKHHPEALMLLLKRFQFDYNYMMYIKNNRSVDVPCTLQIPKDRTYELYAVVDHFGDLRSGHYTATVRSESDGKWYNFDDDRVALINYQPFQSDPFEKSSSAYLLFYRKRKDADTCGQDIMEVSTPGGSPPAAINIDDHYQDAVEMSEGEAQAGDNTKVFDFIRGNEEGIVGAKGVGPPHHPHINVANQRTISSSSQEWKEERNDSGYYPPDAHDETQRDEGKTIKDGIKKVRGNAEAKDKAKKRERLLRENPPEEDVNDQDSGRQMTPDVTHESAFGDRRALHDHPHKQDDQNLKDSVEVGRYPKPVSLDKQGDSGRMEKVDEEFKTGVNERGKELEKPKLYTYYDLFKGTVGDDKQNLSKDDQRCKEGSRKSSESHEQTRREWRGEQAVKEQKRGNDKHAQRKDTSERQQDYGQDDDQEKRHGITQNRSARDKGSNRPMENQKVGSAEKTKLGDTQPNASAEFSDRQPTLNVKIFEKGTTITPSGLQLSQETFIGQETVKRKERSDKRDSGPKRDSEKVSLPASIRNLKLDVPSETEPQKYRSKGIKDADDENGNKGIFSFKARKTQQVSDAEEGHDGSKNIQKKRGSQKNKRKWPSLFSIRKQKEKKKVKKQLRKEKNKKQKSTGCFSFLSQKRQKNADQTSESD